MAVAALSALFAFIMICWQAPIDWRLAIGVILLGLSVWIAIVDLSSYTISDAASASVAFVGMGWRFSESERMLLGWSTGLATPILEAGIIGLVFWGLREIYFRRRGFDGLGFGDVKLAAACTIVLGLENMAWAVLAASLAALIALLLTRTIPRRRSTNKIAFGAFLAPSCALLWILHQWPGLATLGFDLSGQASF